MSTRLRHFEVQLTAQLANLQSALEGRLSHVTHGQSYRKPLDAMSAPTGLDTATEDIYLLKYDVGKLKDLLNNGKEEANHV